MPLTPSRVRSLACLQLAFLLAACSLRAATQPVVDSVVGVRADRGFQGLFEWSPGPYWYNPGFVQGGLLRTCGAVVDLRGLAREEGIRGTLALGDGEGYVVTTLRSVHASEDVWVRFSLTGTGSIPIMKELRAEVVAEDGALNLALLRVAGMDEAPAGLRVAQDAPLRPGTNVLHLHAWEWIPHAFRDEIWLVGHLYANDVADPFWARELPVGRVRSGLSEPMSGDPLVDPTTHELLGIAANGQRLVGAEKGEIWPGVQYVIGARWVRRFLIAALTGRAGVHGALDHAPELHAVTPELARGLGLPRAEGLLVMEDAQSAAAAAFRQGDVLLRAGGRMLGAGGAHLGEVVFDAAPGTSLDVEGSRNGVAFSTSVAVSRRPSSWGTAISHLQLAGAWFQDLPAHYRRAGVAQGVVIAHVEQGSPAAAAQLDFRMMVHEVFGAGTLRPVTTVAELRAAIDEVAAAPGFDGQIGFRVSDLWQPAIWAGTRVLWMPPAGSPASAEGTRR